MEFKFSNPIVLENSRVKLEPLKTIHIESLSKTALSIKNLLKFSPLGFNDEDELKTYVENALNLKHEKLRYPFAIYDKQSSKYAGSTSFMHISNYDKRLEIGSTWIAREFQRSGLNRHCKFLLLQYAFDKLGFDRVEFKTDNRNEQSKTAIQAIGAKYEGTLRKHALMQDGFKRDTVYYSILKEEWSTSKTSIFSGF